MKNIIEYVRTIITFLQTGIWRIRLADKTPAVSFLIKYLRVFLLAAQGFQEDKCHLKASALTFWTVLSIVPVAALVFGIASGFGFEMMLEKELMERIPGQEEAFEQIVNFSHSLLEKTKGGLIAGIGIVILFWTVIKVLGNIEQSLNDIWKIKRSRTMGRKIGDYLSLMIICPFILILSSSATVFITTGITYVSEKVSFLGMISPYMFSGLKLIPYILVWSLFTFIYMIMPNTRVRLGAGMLGGIIGGTIYQLVQWGYITFQLGVSSYNAIYGSFAALPMFLVWMQLSWLIVLFGTEISYACQNIDKYELKPDSDNISRNLKILFTIRIVHVLVKNFSRGNKALSAARISECVEIPICLGDRIVQELVEAGIVSCTVTENDEENVFQPAVDINRLTIYYILNALDRQGTGRIPAAKTREFKALSKSIGNLKDTVKRSPANIRLVDL